ncbi:MAG: tRNA (adenosine(37)-N6)-dimethylallyltransferase MiaA [Spirochaetaceae bacterium]
MSTASKSKSRVIVLFGPTAVGKTELIGQLFSRNTEIISADSLQVYRGMDIGTAKPSRRERERIPHHLIDILDPSESFDAGNFVRAAKEKVEDVLCRGKVPLISGGTAFYLFHFLYGLPEAPPSKPEIRRELETRLAALGGESMYRELEHLDPSSAERIHPHDTYRVLRALEVYRCSGRPLSEFYSPLQKNSSSGEKQDALIIGLYRERQELYRRIDERVERMWNMGLVQEVSSLIRSGYGEKDPGMKGIGYREFFHMRRHGEATLTEVKEEIKKNSRRYAKRQFTFFRKISRAHWFLPEQGADISNLVRPYLADG